MSRHWPIQKNLCPRPTSATVAGMTDIDDLPARYRRFADREARGRSPLYETLTRTVAADDDTLDFLRTLRADKQQPNLLLAAYRLLFGVPAGWDDFRATLLSHRDAVRAVMLTHATQTNEPARCATWLPVLAQLPQPLALIEVGASAGLCLIPDFYGYAYGDHAVAPARSDGHPVFRCEASDNTPLPAGLPDVVWRAGLDLNPLDPGDLADTQWLEALVWAEQTHRLGNLRRSLAIARDHRPQVIRGDLLGEALMTCAVRRRDTPRW